VAFETPATLSAFVLTKPLPTKGRPCTYIRLKRATSRGRVASMSGDRHVTAVRIGLPDVAREESAPQLRQCRSRMTE
jgi:hypothetical protein